MVSCKFSDRGCVDPEPPHFILVGGQSQCLCGRRQSLGLLLANRQIHDEVAPIFWGRNTHSFKNGATFMENISELRRQCREYLQHVRIGHPNRRTQQAPYSGYHYVIWKNIFLCKNLRTLEVESAQPEEIGWGAKVTKGLPHLESLTLARIQKYPCRSENMDQNARGHIWVKITQNVRLDSTFHELFIACRNFSTNRIVHVNYEVGEEFLGQAAQQAWQTPGDPVLAPHLKDNNNIQTVTLRDHTVIDLPIYGLPNSRDTRARHFKQRLFEQNRLKAAGLPGVEETKLALLLKEAKEEKKLQLEMEEQRALEVQQRMKQAGQEEFRKEQAVAESKNKANQHTHKQRKIRKAEKIKHEERKRVPKKT